MDADALRLACELHDDWLHRPPVVDPLVPAHTKGSSRSGHGEAGVGGRGFVAAVVTLVTNRNLLGICLGFFCFDYYWYFLVNWLPDYLVTSRGLTLMTAGIYAALPIRVRPERADWRLDRRPVDCCRLEARRTPARASSRLRF